MPSNDARTRRLAEDLAETTRIAKGSQRAQQIARTTIATDSGSASVNDVLQTAVDTEETVAMQQENLDQVNDNAQLEFDSWNENQLALHENEAESHDGYMGMIDTVERVLTAQEAADTAAQDAANALTTANGKNARRRGKTEPEPPEGGWVQGDQWVVDNAAGVPIEVRVWNGVEFVPEQLLSSDLLVLGPDGTVQIKDGRITAPMIAAGALDAMTVRSLQIYGGYIEAPTIASSSKLGGGANLLNDPRFEGAVGAAWVASGHLGDAAAKQTDTITWNQPWNWYRNNSPTPTSRWVNSGRATADLNLTPRARQTGSITFANYSWLNTAARTIDNPYTFKALYGTNFEGQYGGSIDPTFKEIDFPARKAPTARTTYLTNSAIIAVKSGEKFNVRLEATRVEQKNLDLISTAEIHILNSATSAILWTRKITPEELMNGNVNAFWDSTFTGNIRYRIRVTYTAAGSTMTRRYSASSWAQQTSDGTLFDQWSGSSSENGAIYKGFPREDSAVYFSDNPLGEEYLRRASFDWRMLSASLGKMEGGPGWRLDESTGIELFNGIGERTVLLNGEDNYFTGRISSRNTGARWEILGDKMSLFDGSNTEIANIRRDGVFMRFGGSIRTDGDNSWGRLDSGVVPGATLGSGMVHGVNSLYVGLQARVQDGMLFISGRLERTGGIPANHVLFSLPAAFRSPVPDVTYAYSGGDNFVVLQPNGDCILALPSSSYVTISKMIIPLRN